MLITRAGVLITRRPDHDAVTAAASCALGLELETFPKPGLVSRVDAGSHADMDAATFRRSAASLEPFWARFAQAGAADAPMAELRRIGRAAEAAMIAATGGINTHRGAIFGLGLLAAASGLARPGPLGALVAERWGSAIADGPIPPHSHGAGVLRRHGAGGARAEAVAGFPSVHRVGLPALRAARRLLPDDAEAAHVQTCLALVASVADTNLLHRGGAGGLRFAQAAARRFLDRGGIGAPDWRDRAIALHRAFVARRLSPGGSADLLAMTLFVDMLG